MPAAIDLRLVAAAGAVLLGVFLWTFWDFFARQFAFAVGNQADWGHTLIIPFISGYFVYLKRHELMSAPFRTTWLGLIPLILGIVWYVACNIGVPALRHHNLMGAGVCLSVFGLVLLMCGWRATLVLAFPMIYLFVFGQTISQRLMNIVTYPMQDITAVGAHLVLGTFLEVDRQGNTLFILDAGAIKPLNIAEACSGMRMLMAFLALGVLLAYTGLKRWWQRALLVVMAIPTAIAVNILRVVTLGVLSLYDTEFAAGDFHTFIGLVWLVPAYLLYLGLRAVIRSLVIEVPAEGGNA